MGSDKIRLHPVDFPGVRTKKIGRCLPWMCRRTQVGVIAFGLLPPYSGWYYLCPGGSMENEVDWNEMCRNHAVIDVVTGKYYWHEDVVRRLFHAPKGRPCKRSHLP